MTIAQGVDKSLVIKKETTFGVLAGATDAQDLRRVTSDISLVKDTYESQEIIRHQQVQDFRHGTRRVEGTIRGELSPGSYKLPFQSVLRRDFGAAVTTTSIDDVDAVAGPPGTFTRLAGSFITDGFRVGMIVRWTGFGGGLVANNDRNYRILALTATVMTVSGLLGEAVAAGTNNDAVTCTMVGRHTYVPLTGHTRDSYTIEHWHSDIAQSERFVGCRFGGFNAQLPATGLATVEFPVLGQDMQTATAAYFTTPTAAPSTGIAAAVNGKLRCNGADRGVVTGAQITMANTLTTEAVVGSNISPDVFVGRARITGQITAFFENGDIRDLFLNESETELMIQLALGSGIASDFLNFVMTRVKFGGATKDDGEKGLVMTLPFQALLDTTGGADEGTTLLLQDSTLS